MLACPESPQDQTLPDQWEAQILARILRNHTVIVVTRPEMKSIVEAMKMRYAENLETALAIAHALGKHTQTVIPNGISVIVETGHVPDSNFLPHLELTNLTA